MTKNATEKWDLPICYVINVRTIWKILTLQIANFRNNFGKTYAIPYQMENIIEHKHYALANVLLIITIGTKFMSKILTSLTTANKFILRSPTMKQQYDSYPWFILSVV